MRNSRKLPQSLGYDYQPSPLASNYALALEVVQLLGRALARRADQLGQIRMRQFDRQQRAARVAHAEFFTELEQRARQPLAQSEADEVRVSHQHPPPAADGSVQNYAQAFERDAEHGIDKNFRLHHRDRAIAVRLASERPRGLRQQGRQSENFARPDESHQHALLAIHVTELRHARQQYIDVA